MAARGGRDAERDAAVDRWMRARLCEVPDELADALRGLIAASGTSAEPGADAPGAAGRLARAALDAFERVAASREPRASALELLAADALLTYAFEAAADPALGGSAAAATELAARLGPRGEIGARLMGAP